MRDGYTAAQASKIPVERLGLDVTWNSISNVIQGRTWPAVHGNESEGRSSGASRKTQHLAKKYARETMDDVKELIEVNVGVKDTLNEIESRFQASARAEPQAYIDHRLVVHSPEWPCTPIQEEYNGKGERRGESSDSTVSPPPLPPPLPSKGDLVVEPKREGQHEGEEQREEGKGEEGGRLEEETAGEGKEEEDGKEVKESLEQGE